MAKVRIIRHSNVEPALEGNNRAYLVGDLKIPQAFKHIANENVEIGFSNYDTDGVDTPHYHPVVTEAQVVLSGRVELFDITNDRVHALRPGDFYLVEPNVTHVQKAIAGTRILIVKWPSRDDKTVVEPDDRVKQWMQQPIGDAIDEVS